MNHAVWVTTRIPRGPLRMWYSCAMNPVTTPWSSVARTHAQVDRFSLRLHEEVAKLTRANPAMLDRARANIVRWKKQLGVSAARDLDVWSAILAEPLETILATMVARTEEGDRLRQSSPFCGIVSQARRMEIFREVYPRESREP
ncbi:MAG: hypothetical protein ACYDEV_11125 [Acidiferrobacter sp.]